jgi:hypothetical protein
MWHLRLPAVAARAEREVEPVLRQHPRPLARCVDPCLGWGQRFLSTGVHCATSPFVSPTRDACITVTGVRCATSRFV